MTTTLKLTNNTGFFSYVNKDVAERLIVEAIYDIKTSGTTKNPLIINKKDTANGYLVEVGIIKEKQQRLQKRELLKLDYSDRLLGLISTLNNLVKKSA